MVNVLRRLFGMGDREVVEERKASQQRLERATRDYEEQCHTGPISLAPADPVPVLVPEDDDGE